MLSSVEVCAGAGGQALGLERAGFGHELVLDLDPHACRTLKYNRANWSVRQQDLRSFDGKPFKGVDVLAGGLPCPPFSIAGKQLGSADERNLFPEAIRLTDEIRPRAVMIENVRGLLEPQFCPYREYVSSQLKKMGYLSDWRLLNARDFGVPQLRPRVVFVAIKRALFSNFCWPEPSKLVPSTVGEVLYDLMHERCWSGAHEWRAKASNIAPTIVGGSHKHGGPDLGPTRARKAWAALGVNGLSIAENAPDPDFSGMPRLTVRMVARLQGFPDDWMFSGGKTAAYRQVGNAFPPPVAHAVASALNHALTTR